MPITRRHLLALSAALAASAVAGTAVTAVSWWDRPPGVGYQRLSPGEAAFVRALGAAGWPATRLVPVDGGTIGLDHFLDETLVHLPEHTANLLKMLLHVLDEWPLPRRHSTFSALAPHERTEVLDGWLHHFRFEVRNAAASLLILIGTGWTTHPDVAPFFARWHGCGYGR